MRTALLASAACLAFASGATDAAKVKTPAVAPVAPEAATTKAKTERVAPSLAAVRGDIPMPAAASRGRESQYNFDALDVGQSIGVLNKTASDLSSIVSNQNRKHKVNKTNADGTPVFKDGTTEPVKVAGKKFQVFDVDAATDPDGAKARIFRTA